MSRLPAALLLAWLAVIGASVPAVACAAQDRDDCCPAGQADPCSGLASMPASDAGAGLCCPAVPNESASVGSLQARAEPAKLAGPSDAKLSLISVSDAAAGFRSGKVPAAATHARCPAPDGRVTYLHTGRLRL